MSTQSNVNNEWSKELAEPEVQESLHYLIRKLPEIQQSIQSLEEMVTFGKSILQDKESINFFEKRLSLYPVNAETIEAGIHLLGKLPMLLQHVEMLEQVTVFIQDVLGDKQSLEQINQSISDLPFVTEGKGALEMAQEIKERAATEPRENVSVFTLMKWLKDPTLQQGLHYVKTALTVLGEKQK